MELEYCWFVLGLTGLLSQLGGTFWKSWRREFIALSLAVTWVIFQGFTWWILLYVILQDAAFRMPFTLHGNSIHANGLNLVWLPIWAVFICGSPLLLNWSIWPAVLVLSLILALFGVLSNIKATERFFQWKLVEFFIGVLPAIAMCLGITLT